MCKFCELSYCPSIVRLRWGTSTNTWNWRKKNVIFYSNVKYIKITMNSSSSNYSDSKIICPGCCRILAWSCPWSRRKTKEFRFREQVSNRSRSASVSKILIVTLLGRNAIQEQNRENKKGRAELQVFWLNLVTTNFQDTQKKFSNLSSVISEPGVIFPQSPLATPGCAIDSTQQGHSKRMFLWNSADLRSIPIMRTFFLLLIYELANRPLPHSLGTGCLLWMAFMLNQIENIRF